MNAAGSTLVAALDAPQRERALYAFDDGERFDLRLAPLWLEGLQVGEMREEQRPLLWRLLAAGLSESGTEKVRTIMSLEREVSRLDREASFGWVRARVIDRDPQAYYLTVYGDPGGGGPWGYRFDGHHVSLNYTVVPGETPSATPMFLGGQPRVVREGWERAGLQVLAAEENAARTLYASLEGSARERATLAYEANRGLLLGDKARPDLGDESAGLARGEMSAAQTRALDALIEVYLANLAPGIARARRDAIESDRDAVRFAWAGAAAPGEPHYYRIHGPSFLIEFDNTTADADHIHVVWHDLESDFGLDILQRHYARYPH